MHYSSAKLLAVVLLALVQWHSATVKGAERGCWEEERLALLQIKATFHFPIHSAEGEWEGTDCCRWERVTCDRTTGHVIKLDLGIYEDIDGNDYSYADNQLVLNATIFLPLHQLKYLSLSQHGIPGFMKGAGQETWSNLTRLEILDLSYNYLDGSIISSLATISSLRKLNLRKNDMNSSHLKGLCELNRLEELDLSHNSFTGNLPLCMGNLSSLKLVDLSDYTFQSKKNFISKRSFLLIYIVGLCKLNKLEELDLSNNSFTGNLPLCMGNLSSLELVDLSANGFNIQFPSYIFERLVFLRYLALSDNQLEGTLSIMSFLNHSYLEVLRLSTQASNFLVEVVNIPFQLQELQLAHCVINAEPTFLCSQHKLQVLNLSNTQSKGPIPVAWLLENNTNLIQLDLHKNFFTGPLQLPLLTHKQLSMLDISDNPLGGEIPIDITAKLPNLTFLNLSKNFLQGSLPLISLNNLRKLDLSINNLTQDIQNVFSMFSPSLYYLYVLNLSRNRFYGSLTNNMTITQVSKLLLNDNNLRGEIPFSFCNTSFEVLDISNNKLNGILPDCIGIAGIFALKLSGNHLEGSIPSQICGMEGLLLLDLSNNRLSGPIPPCSNRSELQIVKLSQNNLTGNFPITWLNFSGIKVIDIKDNQLSGELSMWINTESNLRMLQASKNLFEGHIPEQICQWKYLHILDLSDNNLFGQIPSCIINMGAHPLLSSLGTPRVYSLGVREFIGASYTQIDQDIVQNYELQLMSKGRLDMYWTNILLIEGLIDLSSNKLVGNIPNEIGQMTWLITLNLSNNHFNGSIPTSISNLCQLQSLDLSHNSLTGKIPRDMTKLTSLESFSVAYNNLSGPTLDMKAQFGTFDKSSYEGNPNLCGPPLSKSCFPTLDTKPPSPDEMSKDKRQEGTDFLILFGSFSLFFVVSFWGFIAILYFKKNWRYALFTMVDWYGDMIYVNVVLIVRKIGASLSRSLKGGLVGLFLV